MGFEYKKPEILKLLKENDKNNSNRIEFSEFNKLSTRTSSSTYNQFYFIYVVTERILSRDPLEEIRKAFKLFDEDGTGRISLRNLRHIAMELGENIDDDELRAMIDEFDLDGDGESKLSRRLIEFLCLQLFITCS